MKTMESLQVVFTDDSAAIRDLSQEVNSSNYHFLLPEPRIARIARHQVSAQWLKAIEIESEASGDQTGRSMLFGRYMGQISARVERGWRRPRSVPTAGNFSCRVQITQDNLGNVLEVTLEKCTEDSKWQTSLVRAINSASPFPAPPDPAVFSNLLMMEFDSDPYVAGAGEDGFEVALPLADSSNSQHHDAAVSSSTTSEATSRRIRPDGSWDLTIVGSRH